MLIKKINLQEFQLKADNSSIYMHDYTIILNNLNFNFF